MSFLWLASACWGSVTTRTTHFGHSLICMQMAVVIISPRPFIKIGHKIQRLISADRDIIARSAILMISPVKWSQKRLLFELFFHFMISHWAATRGFEVCDFGGGRNGNETIETDIPLLSLYCCMAMCVCGGDCGRKWGAYSFAPYNPPHRLPKILCSVFVTTFEPLCSDYHIYRYKSFALKFNSISQFCPSESGCNC